MAKRRITVKLPRNIPDQQYAQIMFGIHGLLVAAGLAEVSALRSDDKAKDAAMNTAFDEATRSYPWA